DSLEGLEEGTTQETTYAASGAGDVWVSGFYRLAGGGARVYSVDAGLEIKVPTAEEGELGTGEWDYRPVV
ncbi:MAG: hypothetical protein GWO24_14365, partial [Akkermansiaceae bacterium]|nr:hypothetical protein [Akkermansiaceae bacterium]